MINKRAKIFVKFLGTVLLSSRNKRSVSRFVVNRRWIAMGLLSCLPGRPEGPQLFGDNRFYCRGSVRHQVEQVAGSVVEVGSRGAQIRVPQLGIHIDFGDAQRDT